MGLVTPLVLTVGGLWTCSEGKYSVLGHSDEANRLVLTQLVTEHFKENVQIIIVVAGTEHSVVMGSEGGVWTWGLRLYLSHTNDGQERHMLTLLPGAAFAGGKVVMVTAGCMVMVAAGCEQGGEGRDIHI